jgi:nicotinate-nucleotide adenylyltransferase
VLQTRRVDVSSTEVRARLAAGRSIRGFVPEGVADLIRSAGLYR